MFNQELFEKKVQKSIDELKARSHISRLLIALSGGKDSLCLCELIKMAEITNVKYFNMEFLPDLQIQKDLLDYACKRFNIPYEQIIKVPSEHFINCMRHSAYKWYNENAKKEFPQTSRTDIYRLVAQENKGTVITGVKKADSLMMMRKINNNGGVELCPLRDWKLEDVLMFMKLRNINIPDLIKQGVRGVGLEDHSISYIYEHYPEDYKKILETFQFAGAMVHKYKYFDINKSVRRV